MMMKKRMGVVWRFYVCLLLWVGCEIYDTTTAFTLQKATTAVHGTHALNINHRFNDNNKRNSISSISISRLYASGRSNSNSIRNGRRRRLFRSDNKLRRLFSSSSSRLGASKDESIEATSGNTKDKLFDVRTTVSLVAGQSLLIVAAVLFALLIGTPNYGLGPGISFTWETARLGILLTLPMGIVSLLLDKVEDRFPPLQEVTKATQRSVLSLLGGKFKPVTAMVTSIALGIVAGISEEMLFRGVLQYELTKQFSNQVVAVGVSSVIFGALHAVTPLYAILATLASIYFGGMYLWYGNLAVPVICHGFYDIVALMYAHYSVTKEMTEQERLNLIDEWDRPSAS